jgi:hypothetical protein
MPQYFIGRDLGNVLLCQADTFQDVVQRYINVAVPLNCTRAQYAAMDDEQKKAAKRVMYFTPAYFKSNPSKRNTQSALACNLVFLDIDPDKKTGKSPALELVNNINVLREQLAPFSFACYHTASSTPEVPRIRVVVSAENIPLEQYANAVTTIAKRLGLPPPNSESKVSVQAMYLPSFFRGEETVAPMFAYDLGGRAFKASDITDKATQTYTPKEGGASPDLLAFLQAPVDGVTLASTQDALDHIDPDCEYRDWLDVAAGLRHQFWGTDFEEEAYDLFDLWSSKGKKYVSAEETRAKWDSFQHSPVGRLPKTMRTVLQRATVGGWNATELKEHTFATLQQWIRDCESLTLLMNETKFRLLAAPLLTQTEIDALMSLVVYQAQKKFGTKVSSSALRKDLITAKTKMDEEAVGKSSAPPWCLGVMYVSGSNTFYRHRTGEMFSPEAWDHSNTRHLISKDNELLTTPTNFTLNVVKVPVVYALDYDPSISDEVISMQSGQLFVNTYRRTYPPPEADFAQEAGELFTNHLRRLFADPKHGDTILDYCAFIVQCPGKKVRWAPLIQGAQGCGKTLIFETMSFALGKEHTRIVGPNSVLKGYTEWATGKQLVALEEIRIAGQNRHEVMNVLKPLITNTHVPIEQRYQDTREVPNRANYMAFTNHHDALVLTPEDRRWFVLKCIAQTRMDVLAIPHGYFKNYFDFMQNNAGSLRWFLERHKISDDFDPNGHAPMTPFLEQLVHDSASEGTSTVRRLIEEHDHPLVQADIVSSKVLAEMVSLQGVKLTVHMLANVLRDEGFRQIGQHMIKGERHYLWAHINFSKYHSDPVVVAKFRAEKNVTETFASLI